MHVSLQYPEDDLSFTILVLLTRPLYGGIKESFPPLVLAELASTFSNPDIHFKGLSTPDFYVARYQCLKQPLLVDLKSGDEKESRACSKVIKARKRIFLRPSRVCTSGE